MKPSEVPPEWVAVGVFGSTSLPSIAPLIAQAEREACAKVVGREADLWLGKAREGVPLAIEDVFKKYATSARIVVAAIRARWGGGMMDKWNFRLWAVLLSVVGACVAVKGGFMNGAAWWDGVASVAIIGIIIHFAISAWRRA